MSGVTLKRLRMVIEPEPGNDLEANGILNPAAVRGKDGQLYLFPRMVAKGNFSRIGIARVKFNKDGDPTGIERLGVALEPKADYEIRPDGGGCEDARVTYVEPLGHYVMSYTAFSPHGPRIAFATSENLFHWERMGLATYAPYDGIKIEEIDNKDSCVFPLAVNDPKGKPALALLHRPLFQGTRPAEKAKHPEDEPTDMEKESIWIAYRDMDLKSRDAQHLRHFTSHHRLAAPAARWERLKIGCGAPPVLTPQGWLVIYHGVGRTIKASADGRRMVYSAGLMILDRENPQRIIYRSPHPVLRPTREAEKNGIVASVVFPTGVDRRDDIGQPNRLDVYYGMADDRIGAATIDMGSEEFKSLTPQ